MTGVMLQKVAQKLTVPTCGVGEWGGDLETGWEEALPWVGILYVRPEADRREWRDQEERPSLLFLFLFSFLAFGGFAAQAASPWPLSSGTDRRGHTRPEGP